MYVKGAAEHGMNLCNYTMNKEGDIEELADDDKDAIMAAINNMTYARTKMFRCWI